MKKTLFNTHMLLSTPSLPGDLAVVGLTRFCTASFTFSFGWLSLIFLTISFLNLADGRLPILTPRSSREHSIIQPPGWREKEQNIIDPPGVQSENRILYNHLVDRVRTEFHTTTWWTKREQNSKEVDRKTDERTAYNHLEEWKRKEPYAITW